MADSPTKQPHRWRYPSFAADVSRREIREAYLRYDARRTPKKRLLKLPSASHWIKLDCRSAVALDSPQSAFYLPETSKPGRPAGQHTGQSQESAHGALSSRLFIFIPQIFVMVLFSQMFNVKHVHYSFHSIYRYYTNIYLYIFNSCFVTALLHIIVVVCYGLKYLINSFQKLYKKNRFTDI